MNEFTLEKGTIIFQGDRRKHKGCIKNIFRMKGQRGISNKTLDIKYYVSFFTFDMNTALTYAGCGNQNGWVHMFKTNKNLKLYNMIYSQDPDLIDTEDVEELYCPTYNGLYIDYEKDIKDNEIAICDPENHLEYVSSKKCKDEFFKKYNCI